MPLFSQIHWRGIGATVAVELLAVFALVLAFAVYVEWSSDTAVAEFMPRSARLRPQAWTLTSTCVPFGEGFATSVISAPLAP